MVPVLVTPPSRLPVDMDELRLHLRVDHHDDDLLINYLATAAVGHLDGFSGVLGRAIMPQTWAQTWTCAGPYTLALPDVDAGSLVVTADGVAVPGGDVTTELTFGGLVVTVAGSPALPVQIEYECAMPAAQLGAVRAAILMMVGHWYANRETVGQTGAEMPFAASALIAPLRRVRV